MADQSTQPTRTHKYHAEATVLKGDLYHPLVQQIKPQTNVKLSEHGGYLSEHAEPYRLEGVVSFERAYTQTAGNPNPKPDGGWTSLVTSVVEQLNVLEVVTADRIVAQIATHHPAEGYVPSVHFLGTRFENLRIGGRPVKVDLIPDPYFLTKPENDGPYTQHPGFLERAKSHFERLSGSTGVPEGLLKRYHHLPVTSEDEESIEFSLVTQVEAPSFGRSYGHVIEIEDFGKIHLGLLKIKHSDYDPQKHVWKKTLFDLTMIELELGCLAEGTAALANSIVNGGTAP
jgi:hypothetical protein